MNLFWSSIFLYCSLDLFVRWFVFIVEKKYSFFAYLHVQELLLNFFSEFGLHVVCWSIYNHILSLLAWLVTFFSRIITIVKCNRAIRSHTGVYFGKHAGVIKSNYKYFFHIEIVNKWILRDDRFDLLRFYKEKSEIFIMHISIDIYTLESNKNEEL